MLAFGGFLFSAGEAKNEANPAMKNRIAHLYATVAALSISAPRSPAKRSSDTYARSSPNWLPLYRQDLAALLGFDPIMETLDGQHKTIKAIKTLRKQLYGPEPTVKPLPVQQPVKAPAVNQRKRATNAHSPRGPKPPTFEALPHRALGLATRPGSCHIEKTTTDSGQTWRQENYQTRFKTFLTQKSRAEFF